MILVGAGCNRNAATNTEPEKDQVFSDPNTQVTFTVPTSLKVEKATSEPGNVSVILKKNSQDGLLDNVRFSTKTREAWLNEMVKARVEKPNQVCQNNEAFGCEKWDEEVSAYQRAVRDNNFGGYYALGTNKVTINGVPFVVAVTYNLDTQQYQTKYVAYVNNTRITFIDPATGGLEYGFPFQMDAKNREMVETLGQRIAKREKIDDVKTRARADSLYQLVSTVKINK